MDISRYHKVLFEHFGFNFGFVSDLLENYLENPESVSDYWKNYFTSLLNNGDSIPIKTIELKPIEPQMLPEQVKPIISNSFEISPSDSVQKITGVGAKIIENMTSSLSIPTATSLRAISVKLLEENRRIINRQLQRSGKGKVSFTHIVAYAIVQSAKTIPNLNNAFSIVDGKPVLVKKPYINLGIAVDVERKDGSRSLIVPNIKNSEKMNFK
ncbi:MAG: 2-oxo acid dehydrogenase subunit E2, partial [Ignavibacteria bacterium]|nr:2-oxo acid dehydrogenase subunit E2 [Ignavibacteria bacterium]